jgi:hypothetical protein
MILFLGANLSSQELGHAGKRHCLTYGRFGHGGGFFPFEGEPPPQREINWFHGRRAENGRQAQQRTSLARLQIGNLEISQFVTLMGSKFRLWHLKIGHSARAVRYCHD